MEALRQEEQAAKARSDSDELESEEGADSDGEGGERRRRAERKASRRAAKQAAEAERQRRIEERRAILRQKEAALNCSDGDEDAVAGSASIRVSRYRSRLSRHGICSRWRFPHVAQQHWRTPQPPCSLLH